MAEASHERAARRYARAAFFREEPTPYESVNELALKWGRDRIVRFSCLTFGLLSLTAIAAMSGRLAAGSPILLYALVVSWVWRGGNSIRHYLTFARKIQLGVEAQRRLTATSHAPESRDAQIGPRGH